MKQSVLRLLSRRYFLIPAALLLLYTLLGFFVAPIALRWYLPIFSGNQLNSHAEVARISINPFLLTLDAKNFSLKGPDGEPLAGIGRLFLRFELGGLFDKTARFREFFLENPSINLVIDENGAFNFAQLAPQSSEKPVSNDSQSTNSKSTQSDPARVILENFAITNGLITITDRRVSSPASLAINDISLDLKALSTLRGRNGTYSLSARSGDGESVQWQGEISLVPFRSKGKVTCSGILAKTPWGFLRNNLNLDAPMGKINLSTDYHIDTSDATLQLVLENLRMDLGEFSLKLTEAEEVFFKLDKFDLESAKFDLASRTVQVGKILLDGGKLRLHIDNSGRMNIQRLVRNSAQDGKKQLPVPVPAGEPENQPESPAWTAILDSVEIKNIALGLEDLTRTAPLYADISSISIGTRAKVEAGRNIQVQLGGIDVDLAGVQLGNKNSPGSIFNVQRLLFEDCALDLAAQTITASSIRLNDGQLDAGLDRDGNLNLQSTFSGKSNEAQNADVPRQRQSNPKSGWKYLVKAFELKDFRSAITDYRVSEKPLYNIKGLNVRITGIDGKSPMGVELGFGVEQGGNLALQGKVDPSAQSVEVKVSVGDLSLAPVQLYLAPYITLTLQSATVSTEGIFRYGDPKSASRLGYEGNLSIGDLSLTQPGSNETYLGWGAMRMPKLKMALEPNSLQVDEIKLSKPVGELIIAEDRTINLTKILKQQPPAQSPPVSPKGSPAESARQSRPGLKQPEKREDSFPFNIDLVRIDEGNLVFADLSLFPKFMTRIHDLKGTITRLSSEKRGLSKIELTGGVDRYGLAKVSGALDLSDYKRSTELNLVFRNIEMAGITPYSGKFAGRKIKSGKLSTDLKYEIRDNKLVGDNKIIVDNLVLGEHVDSPNAVNLPLDLAVALLADSSGRIDIGLPISGDLDDPKFSVAPLVWKAITALISKTALAPFRALGGLFGGESHKLDTIPFDPGKAELMPPEKEKLKKVADGLKTKSKLMVIVQGRYSAEVDGNVLKELNLRSEVARQLGTQPVAGKDPGPLNLGDSKVRRVLEKMFTDRFGDKALDEINQAVKKGEISPRENTADAVERKKSKKNGLLSRAFSAVKVYKILPGGKSPEQSELLAGELYFRLVESDSLPEKDLLRLASDRGQVIIDELLHSSQIPNTRVQTAPAEPLSGDEGLSARLSLEPVSVSASEPVGK